MHVLLSTYGKASCFKACLYWSYSVFDQRAGISIVLKICPIV